MQQRDEILGLSVGSAREAVDNIMNMVDKVKTDVIPGMTKTLNLSIKIIACGCDPAYTCIRSSYCQRNS